SRVNVRMDITAEKAYTLSKGTRAILAKLDTPVTIRLYCSKVDGSIPVPIKAYAQRVEDLLAEFREASNGKVEIQKLNPAPNTEAEDSARMDGIEPQGNYHGEPVYLGASV